MNGVTRETDQVILSHYIVCNDTSQPIRFGQVGHMTYTHIILYPGFGVKVVSNSDIRWAQMRTLAWDPDRFTATAGEVRRQSRYLHYSGLPKYCSVLISGIEFMIHVHWTIHGSNYLRLFCRSFICVWMGRFGSGRNLSTSTPWAV